MPRVDRRHAESKVECGIAETILVSGSQLVGFLGSTPFMEAANIVGDCGVGVGRGKKQDGNDEGMAQGQSAPRDANGPVHLKLPWYSELSVARGRTYVK
jgi:hypothetical protein